MRRVMKFGGTSIADSDKIRRAAECVKKLTDAGDQIVVVVSAQGDDTNRLLESAYGVSNGSGDMQDVYRIALLGEEKSMRLMCAALKSLKTPAVPFIPVDRDSWPIIVDSDDHSPIARSKINEERLFTLRGEKTAQRFRQHVAKHLRVGAVPVLAGFFALSTTDQLVTLGRGGSDITAFIAGRYIGADEVIIVTDVEGVLSGDPRITGDEARLIKELSVEDLEAMSGAGSRVIHPRALRFKVEEIRARIVDFKHLDDIANTGTSIIGSSQSSLVVNPNKLSFITLVGVNLARQVGLIAEVTDRLTASKIPLNSMVCNDRFIAIFLEDRFGEEAYKVLHNLVSERRDTFQNTTIKGGVGEILLRSALFIDEPGILSELTGILSTHRINIIDVVSTLSDVYVYLKYEDVPVATEALRKMVDKPETLF